MKIKNLVQDYPTFAVKVWESEMVIWNGVPEYSDRWFVLIAEREIKSYEVFENEYGDQEIEIEVLN